MNRSKFFPPGAAFGASMSTIAPAASNAIADSAAAPPGVDAPDLASSGSDTFG